MEIYNFIPTVLTWQNGPINDRESHRNLCEALYNTLTVVQNENGRNSLKCIFFQLNQQQIQVFKGFSNELEKDPLWLYRLCMWSTHSPIQLTRDLKENIIEKFDNNNLNTVIIKWYHSVQIRTNPQVAEPSLIDSFFAFMNKIANISGFFVKKSIKAKLLMNTVNRWTTATPELQAKVSDMLMGLTPKQELFDEATTLLNARKDSEKVFPDYINYTLENLESATSTFNGLNYLKNTHFVFTDFKNSFNDKSIWFSHHYRYQNQVESIITEQHLAPISRLLDSLVEQIYKYQPDQAQINTTKTINLKERINFFLTDFSTFQEPDNQNESKCKIMINTCKFLLAEAENLSLQGIQFHEDNFGISRNNLEDKLIYLESFLTQTKIEQDKKAAEIKSAASELSKTLTLAALPELKNSTQWLSWYASWNRVTQHFKSNLARISLIRASITKQYDLDRLDSMTNYQQMLQYLQSTYGQIDSVIPQMLHTLRSLPPAHNEFILIKNYNKFMKTIEILRENNLENKVDRYLIEIIIPRIFTLSQREQYFKSVVQKESAWRLEAKLPPQTDVDQINILNTNEIFEKLSRDHFFKFAADNYLTTRKLVTNQTFQNHASIKPKRNFRRSFNFNTTTNDFSCPFCQTTHLPNLTRCPNFNKMNPSQRLEKLKSHKNFCKRCLHFIPQIDKHEIQNDRCPNQQRTGPCNKCGKFSHSSYLHINFKPNSSNFTQKKNFRGNKNQKKTYGQFKRPNRNSRLAQSAKVNCIQEVSDSREVNEENFISELDNLSVHTILTSFHNDNPEEVKQQVSRNFLTCVSLSRIQTNQNPKNLLTLLDECSLLNFVVEKTIKGLGYEPKGTWRGTLQTILGKNEVSLPIFIVNFITKDNKIEKIPLLGLKYLAFKQRINPKTFNYIVQQTGLPSHKFLNLQGPVQILLGLRSARFLPTSIHLPDSFQKLFPDLRLLQNSLSHKFFFSGTFTSKKYMAINQPKNPNPIHTTLTFPTIVSNFTMIVKKGPKRPQNDPHQNESLFTKYPVAKCNKTTHTKNMKHPVLPIYYGFTFFLFSLNIFHIFYQQSKQNITPSCQDDIFHGKTARKRNNLSISSLFCFIAKPDKQNLTLDICPLKNDNNINTFRYQVNNSCLMPITKSDKQISKPLLSWTFFNTFYFPKIPIYLSEMSMHKFNFERLQKESLDYLRIFCQQCEKRSLLCKDCRYYNSNLSLAETREMTIMLTKFRNQQIEQNVYQIFTGFMYTLNPHKIFTQQNSNYILALESSKKLRKRLEKISLLNEFHQLILKEEEKGFLKPVSFSTMQNTKTLNFISINYSEKESSSSSPIRVVSNCSFMHKSGHPLNSVIPCGPNLVASAQNILYQLRLSKYAAFSDLSSAYKTIKLEQLEADLLMFCWFSNPSDPQTLQIYQCTSLPFGLSSSACILELSLRNIIAPACKTDVAKQTLLNHRYIDDFVLLHNGSFDQLIYYMNDLKTTLESFSFKIKETHFSPKTLSSKNFSDQTINFLSFKICLKSDMLKPLFFLHPNKKVRGKYSGQRLNKTVIPTLKITKKLISRILGQIFGMLNILIEPLNSILKLYFSQSCRLTQNWNENLDQISTSFTKSFRSFLYQLEDIEYKIDPIKRNLLPENEKIIAIISCSDAGEYQIGVILYLLTKDQNNEIHCNIIDSKSKASNYSIPKNECISIKVAIQFLYNYLKLTGYMFTDDFKIYLCNDSKVVSFYFNPRQIINNILIKNSVNYFYRILEDLFIENQHLVSVSMIYLNTSILPADVLTKLPAKHILEILNSSQYRHGPQIFCQANFPAKEDVYFYQERGKFPVFQPLYNTKSSKLLTHVNMISAIPKCTCTENKPLHVNADSINFAYNPLHCQVHCIDYTCCNSEETSSSQNIVFTNNVSQMTQLDEIASDTVIFDISANFFDHMIARYSSLLTLLNVLALCKALFYKKKSPTFNILRGYKTFQSVIFLSLIKTHQHIFGLPKRLKLIPVFKDKGVYFTSFRFPFSTMKDHFYVEKIPIFNPEDKIFLKLLISKAHCIFNQATFSQLHCTLFLTKVNIQRGNFAIFAPSINKYISNYIKNCGVCNRINKHPYQVEKSGLRFLHLLKNTEPCLFQYISLDTLPAINIRLSKADKTFRKFSLYIILCLVSGMITTFIQENTSLESTRRVLKDLQIKYGIQIKYILADHGVEYATLKASDSIFQCPVQINIIDPQNQKMSVVESHIKTAKKLMQSIFVKTNKSFPNFTFTQFQSTILLIIEILNCRPITRQYVDNDSYVYFSPNMFMRFYSSKKQFSDETFKNFSFLQHFQENFNDLLSANKEMRNHVFINIKNALYYNSIKFSNKYYTKRHRNTKPALLDICLKKSDENFKICRIVQLNNAKNFAQIEIIKRDKVVQEGCHISNLSLLYRYFDEREK